MLTRGVLLDIDGSMIELPENDVHRDAFIWAVQVVFEISLCDFSYDGLSGLTERRIFFEILKSRGYPEEKIESRLDGAYYFMRLYCECYSEVMVASLLPGVRELLNALRNAGVLMCWASGTIRDVALLKLEVSGLSSFDLLGIFGNDFYDRAEMLRAGERLLEIQDECKLYVVGDTVADIRAALNAGMISIAVATGRDSVDELRVAGADYVFEDLSDTGAVLQVILGQ